MAPAFGANDCVTNMRLRDLAEGAPSNSALAAPTPSRHSRLRQRRVRALGAEAGLVGAAC